MVGFKMLIGLLLFIGLVGLGAANGYLNQAFWQSEILWLDEDDFDEDVDRWLKYGNLAFKISICSCVLAGILALIYWFFL